MKRWQDECERPEGAEAAPCHGGRAELETDFAVQGGNVMREREREREIEPRERFTSFRSLELPSSRRKLYST